MKNIFWVLIGIVVVSAIVGVFALGYIQSIEKPVSSGVPTPTIKINYSNFASEISKNSMIKALPKNEKVLLKLYNFNSGERAFEKRYYLSATNIEETNDENAEVIVLMSSKYMDELTNKNLCSVFKKANNNGDLGIESSISMASLAWKFKSMMKYKDCF